MSKRWPTYDDLRAWYLYHLLDTRTVDNPGEGHEIIEELERAAEEPTVLHAQLYEEYEEFREEFMHVDEPH